MQRLLPTVSLIALVVLANSVLYHDRVLSMETQASGRAVVTQADYDRWKTELSNWGRWGPDDQMGALNLITPDKRKEAATLVVDGVTVSMAAVLFMGILLFKKPDDALKPSWIILIGFAIIAWGEWQRFRAK